MAKTSVVYYFPCNILINLELKKQQEQNISKKAKTREYINNNNNKAHVRYLD